MSIFVGYFVNIIIYKPWIKKEILSSIRKREKFYKKIIKAKDKVIKEVYHKKYKELRNQILDQCRL